jgi:hypothetical protein
MIEQARAIGIRAFIFKPVRGEDLVSDIGMVLDGKAAPVPSEVYRREVG